jgi:hypothetical protein
MFIFIVFWSYGIRHKNYHRSSIKLLDNFYDSFHEWLIFTKAIIQFAIVRLTHLALTLIKVNVVKNKANIELHL